MAKERALGGEWASWWHTTHARVDEGVDAGGKLVARGDVAGVGHGALHIVEDGALEFRAEHAGQLAEFLQRARGGGGRCRAGVGRGTTLMQDMVLWCNVYLLRTSMVARVCFRV